MEQQTEEEVFEVLKSLVKRSPEAKGLFKEIRRELDLLRRIDKLRKY